MTNAIALMKQIEEVLSGYDAKVLQSLIDSIPKRRKAVAAVRATRSEFKGQYATTQYAYAQMEAAGGKGWSELLRSGDAYIVENLTKAEAMKAEARAAKIAAKLAKAGVKEVMEGNAEHTLDGFNGWWKVITDQGPKMVKLEIISAGGYNVQCYHYRVLCSVK